jgi:hypothetical protein
LFHCRVFDGLVDDYGVAPPALIDGDRMLAVIGGAGSHLVCHSLRLIEEAAGGHQIVQFTRFLRGELVRFDDDGASSPGK